MDNVKPFRRRPRAPARRNHHSGSAVPIHAAFTKLWPTLLTFAAVEAFAELQKDRKFEPVKTATIKAVIEDADKAQASSRTVTAGVELVTRESKDNIVFETRDRGASTVAAEWVHRCYLTK